MADYRNALNKIPSIINLLGNPFILYIAMRTLPSLMNRWKALRITRIVLYDSFVDNWFKHAQERLHKKQTSNAEVVKKLNRHFIEDCKQFCMCLAV